MCNIEILLAILSILRYILKNYFKKAAYTMKNKVCQH